MKKIISTVVLIAISFFCFDFISPCPVNVAEATVIVDNSVTKDSIIEECEFIHLNNFINLDTNIFKLMVKECDAYHIPYSIFFSVVDKESGFRFIKNTEGSNAMGYMQMMPKTFSHCAKKLHLKDGHTPINNVRAGAYHLYTLHSFWKRKYHNDKIAWKWALAEYATGLAPMQVKDSSGKVISYQIVESSLPGVNKVLRNY